MVSARRAPGMPRQALNRMKMPTSQQVARDERPRRARIDVRQDPRAEHRAEHARNAEPRAPAASRHCDAR